MRSTPSSRRPGTELLRVAVVGPTHPYKGGVAAHTTALAHELRRAGHDVELVSWRHLYPSLLYPGRQKLGDERPDVEPFDRTSWELSWARPDSWWRVGRRLREVDVIVVVHVVPQVVPAHLVLTRAARRRRGSRPRVVGVVHNVLPHEAQPGADLLMRRFFSALDGTVVHSAEQGVLAEGLGAQHVEVARLPPHLPGGPPVPRPPHDGPARLLTLGLVRDYKGIDLVLEGLQYVPDVTLTIAGELWGAAGERVKMLAADPLIAERVHLQPGYVPADRIAPLLAQHDVLMLAYRSATSSQNVLLAHHHGLPVVVSRVGTLPDGVREGVDGLVVEPDDTGSLVAALHRIANRDFLERLRDGVQAPDLVRPWSSYVVAVEAAAQ